MVASNEKGADFERKCCNRLSLWVSGGTRTDVYWRSAMSGGRATLASHRTRGRAFTAQAGDISAIHACGHALLDLFMIECKFYRDLILDAPLFGIDGQLKVIWHKPVEEATGAGVQPFVIAKENKRQEVVMTTYRGAEILRAAALSEGHLPLLAYFPQVGMYVFSFRDVITDVDPAMLKRKPVARKTLKV